MQVLKLCTFEDDFPPFLYEVKGLYYSFSIDMRSIYWGYLYYLATEDNFAESWEDYLYHTMCDIRDISNSKLEVEKKQMDFYIKQMKRICNLMYTRYVQDYVINE